MKKNKIIIIACIVILGICLVGFGIFSLMNSNQKQTSNPEESSDPNNSQETVDTVKIKIVDAAGYDITANTINNDNAVAVLLKETEGINQMLKIKFDLLDENGKTISSEEQYFPILGNSYAASSIPLIDADGKSLDVKTVEINISKEGNYMSQLQANLFDYDSSNSIDGRKINTTLNITYQGNENLSMISGSVVALKENKIIGLIPFTKENVMANSISTISVDPIEVLSVEDATNSYDNILVFVNNLGF